MMFPLFLVLCDRSETVDSPFPFNVWDFIPVCAFSPPIQSAFFPTKLGLLIPSNPNTWLFEFFFPLSFQLFAVSGLVFIV